MRAAALLCLVVHAAVAAAAPAWLVSNHASIGGGNRFAALVTALAVDAQGDNVVAGLIGPGGFAGLDSAQVTNAGAGARFVARYDAASGAQQFVALVGSARGPDGRITLSGLALDANGNAYLPAYAASLDFPLTGGTYVAAGLPYLYRVSPLGQVTRLAAPLDPAIRTVRAVALDAAGNLLLTGSAGAGLVTTVGAPYATPAVSAGCIAPFVAKLDRTGQTVMYATYLGYAGTAGERCGGNVVGGPFDPAGYAIAVDAAGAAYVTGQAEPGVRATAGAVDRAPTTSTLYAGGQRIASHAFVTKIDASGTAIAWSVRLGGNNHDRGTAIVLDAGGNAYVAGKTTTYSFPTLATAWPTIAVVQECLLNTPELGFLAKLSPDGTQLVWAGLLPGAGQELDECSTNAIESPLSLAADASGMLFVLGDTQTSNRITTLSRNAIQSQDGDAFLAQVSFTGQLVYSSWISGGSSVIALDGAQSLRLAGGAEIQQISAGSMPVAASARSDPACAGAPSWLDVRVAGAGNAGTVDVQVDGTSVGYAPLQGGLASLATTLAPGVHRLTAVYHGPGMFDGYASSAVLFAVNQAGACS